MSQTNVTKYAKLILVLSSIMLTVSLMAAHHHRIMHHRDHFEEHPRPFEGGMDMRVMMREHHRHHKGGQHSHSHSHSMPIPEPVIPEQMPEDVPERAMAAQAHQEAEGKPEHREGMRHREFEGKPEHREGMRHREFEGKPEHREGKPEHREGMRHREFEGKPEHREGQFERKWERHGHSKSFPFPRRFHGHPEEHREEEHMRRGPHHFCFGALILAGVSGLVAGFTERRCAATVFTVLVLLAGLSAIGQHGHMVHRRVGECRMEEEFRVPDRMPRRMPVEPRTMDLPMGAESRQAMPKEIMIDAKPIERDCRPDHRDVGVSVALLVMTAAAVVLAAKFRRAIVTQALAGGYSAVVVEGAVLDEEPVQQKTVECVA